MPQPSKGGLLHHARREALFVAGMWLAAMVYTVGYSALFGYREPATAPLRLVFGFPHWVFWGIVVPWVTCVLVGTWFAYAFMQDDDVSDGMAPEEWEENASA